MNEIRVEQLLPGWAEAYDRYLLSRPEALFFYCSKYKDFLKALLGCEEEYLLAIKDGSICGVLPLMFIERGGRRVYNSLPFYGSNGGILADGPAPHAALGEAYQEIACRKTTLSSTLVTNPLLPPEEQAPPHNYSDCRIGMFTDTSFASNQRKEIMARIDASARRNLQKAEREGVSVEIDHTQIERLKQMHKANMEGIGGLPKSDAFFALIPEHFKPVEDFDIYVAKKDGLVIAGLLVFYFNQTAEYFTPAIDAEYRSGQPLSLILIDALANASRRGFALWNWGGTGVNQVGVYRFKKKWASFERRYDYYTQLNDASILEMPPEEIMAAFPNFYVAPFSVLKRKE